MRTHAAQHHSITSSAVASSAVVILRPSALAVFQIDHQLYRSACSLGGRRLSNLATASQHKWRNDDKVDEIGAISEQTTFDRIFSPVVNSRNSILRGEVDDLPPVGGPDGVRKHEQALDIIRSHGLEGRTDVLDRAFYRRQNIKMLFRGCLLKPAIVCA